VPSPCPAICISFVNFATAHSGGRGPVRFPFGWCLFGAIGTTAKVTLGAKDSVDLERVEEILIDRLLGLRTAAAKAWKSYGFLRNNGSVAPAKR
jgi:hypothetical protein